MKRLIFAVLFTSIQLFSAEATSTEGKLSHESEAGVVLTTGNSDTQTYNVKQATNYEWSGNTGRFTGSYLLGKTSGLETAKKWDLGLRYERALLDSLSVFAGYQIDANPFAGTYFRHTVDLGGKYTFVKNDSTSLLAEAGYRVTAEKFTSDNGATSNANLTSHMSRVYVEWAESWNKALSTKLWAEYIQSYTVTSDYRFNVEPSLSVLLNEVFSVKMAYLFSYRNVPAVAGKKQTDTIYTTSLVAKF